MVKHNIIQTITFDQRPKGDKEIRWIVNQWLLTWATGRMELSFVEKGNAKWGARYLEFDIECNKGETSVKCSNGETRGQPWWIGNDRRNVMELLRDDGIKGNTVFALLFGSFTLETLPPCYEEAQAVWRGTSGGELRLPDQLQAESQHQLTSHVNASSWKWILQPSVELPSWCCVEETRAFPLGPTQITDLWQSKNC